MGLRKRVVGYVSVDSGLMMLGDPGYVIGEPLGKMAWEEFLDRHCEPGDKTPRVFHLPHIRHPESGVCLAVVTGTGDGDGIYPVEIEIDREGRVRKLSISFK